MTSALPIHPWFRNASLKRKGSYTVDSPDIATFETSPRTKRRRCDNLEHGFAQMTLNPAAIVPPVQQQPLFMQNSPFGSNPPPFQALGGTVNLNGTSIPPAADTTVQPTDVPSPVPVDIDPPSPRSKSSVPSWYEPQKDRIVITSLDSESDGEEERPTTTDRAYDGDSEDENVKVTVPSAFLDRLRKRQALDMDLPALLRGPESDPSKALVLFRPLGVPNTSDESSPSAVDRGYEVEEEREDPDTEQEDYMSGTPLDAASPIIPVEDGVEVEDITDNNADMDDAMDVEPL